MTDSRRLTSPTGNPLHPLEKRVYQELKHLKPELENKIIVVAVSGGIDSVVLLHVLVAVQSRFNYKIQVVHINHGVRGPESDADSVFVSLLAKRLGVPLLKKKLGKFKKNPSENTLREGRYTLLFKAGEKFKAPFIITAHHLDDLLETRLMRLLHGTGMRGLTAMTLLSAEGILRPFISLTRRDIEEYARSRNLEWRNDATNFDTTKFRNWIRRNWIGALRREHPEYLAPLAASLERIISTYTEAVASEGEGVSRTFNRHTASTDEKVFSYLRYYSKKRVTSRHVAEFKKQIQSPKKRFTFRLAGVDWLVDKGLVEPGNSAP